MKAAVHGQKLMLLIMLNMFIVMLGVGLIIPVLPEFLKEFEAGGTTAGYLVAAFGLTQFVFSPLAGEWSDKYGRRLLIIIGMVLFTISNLVFAMAETLPMLYISRLIGGAGAAATIPAMLAYVADITTNENRGKGLGLIGAAMSLGFAIGPGIGGFLAELGLRAPFYVSAIVGALATVISLLFLPESLSEEARLAAKQVNTKRENIFQQINRSFKSSYFLLLILVFSLTFGLANFEAIFPLFVDKKFLYTPRDISIIITVGALAGTIVQGIFIGRLIQRFGEKNLINLTFLLSAIAMILMLLSGNFIYILILTTLFFTFTSIMRPAINTLLSKSAGEEQGFVAGMNNAYMSIGNIFGPAVAGILFDVHVNAPYLLGAVILLLSLGLSLSKRRGRVKPSLSN